LCGFDVMGDLVGKLLERINGMKMVLNGRYSQSLHTSFFHSRFAFYIIMFIASCKENRQGMSPALLLCG
jgi:hypothetical protein